MRILIIGTGYVGLVTGTCFAEVGHTTLCLDIDKEKIAELKKGVIPFFEPGLKELVDKNYQAERLFFTDTYHKALQNIDVCFIAVATPSNRDGSCDLSYVFAAAKEIAENMEHPLIIVNKSTVPIGTHASVAQIIKKTLEMRGVSIPFEVVSNPEFLQEGTAVKNCMEPDRIIIGANAAYALEKMQELYAPFNLQPSQFFLMDPLSAELAKYASNAMLATRISFMNELACICEETGANVEEIRIAIGSDKRIGQYYLYPGIGFGGSCLPKDLKALRHMASSVGYEPHLLKAVETINHRQKNHLNQKIDKYFASRGGLQNKTLAIWGLSFKPETDDLREAPSFPLIKHLLIQGAKLRLYDPVSMEKARLLIHHSEEVLFCEDAYEAAYGADAVVLVTEWKQFRLIDLDHLRKIMNGNVFFDGRNQFQPKKMTEKGFDYFGIGISNQESYVSSIY